VGTDIKQKKMLQIDPPGTWCLNETFFQLIGKICPHSFIEVGPGEGHLSARLCNKSIKGYGIDFSQAMIEILKKNMQEYIDRGVYSIIEADVMTGSHGVEADLVFSMLVMEHLEDDLLFLDRLKMLARNNGYIIIAVPGRVDKWGIEDEVYGHYRRYDRKDLFRVMEEVCLKDIIINSVGFPVSNILFNLGNLMTRRSLYEEMNAFDMMEKTKNSGLKNVPYKTLFPAWVKLLLNRYTMFPVVNFQKLFYHTNLGLTLIGCGRVSE
jgi:SAM-dependent methyltransferase